MSPEKGNATLLLLWLSEYANNPALDKPYVGLWTPRVNKVYFYVYWGELTQKNTTTNLLSPFQSCHEHRQHGEYHSALK